MDAREFLAERDGDGGRWETRHLAYLYTATVRDLAPEKHALAGREGRLPRD
ncbi:hypothetical protein ACFVIM_22905 [Streptomyces sp. NPDC057638]|uniref:hypothetical protein n=1 Tax=Streptomyces sp. NPDC057638 TaxID=3346190 RepID=UPI0036979E4C